MIARTEEELEMFIVRQCTHVNMDIEINGAVIMLHRNYVHVV